MDASAPLHFELILHPQPHAGAPAAATVEQHRPDPAAVQAVLAWLGQHGMQGNDAGFSVAASAPREVFERHFGRDDPCVPPTLAAWVREVVVPPPPLLFA
jgi:hypothetical protein